MLPDDPATRRKRLAHRSRYRGFLEADLVFGRFADAHLDGLAPAELELYESLLDENDHDLWAWVTRQRPVPARHDHAVMRKLQDLAYMQRAHS